MTSRLFVQQEAEADLLEAFRWYQALRAGLGDEFLECVEDVLESITASPESHAIVHKSVRLALLRRFPYIVCYTWEGGRIDVVAVYHGHRDPTVWQSRIE